MPHLCRCFPGTGHLAASTASTCGGAGQEKVWGFLDSTPQEGTSCSSLEVALQSCSPRHLSILGQLHSPTARGGSTLELIPAPPRRPGTVPLATAPGLDIGGRQATKPLHRELCRARWCPRATGAAQTASSKPEQGGNPITEQTACRTAAEHLGLSLLQICKSQNNLATSPRALGRGTGAGLVSRAPLPDTHSAVSREVKGKKNS